MGKTSTREEREGMPPKRGGSFPSHSSSPSSSSSSSSDFEFTVSLSPSSRRSPSNLCPADELFYKGQLLPLHLSPRISMVRTLLLASSSTSSSDTNTTASRDSNGSSSSSISSSSSGVPPDLLLLPECDSSRPSSVTEEEARRAIVAANKRSNYFSNIANRFSSVFLTRGGSKKDASFGNGNGTDVVVDFQMSMTPGGKRTNSSAKQVIKKYVKKVKPLYEKLSSSSSSSSQKNQNQNQNQNQNGQPQKKKTFSFSIIRRESTMKKPDHEDRVRGIYSHSHSFSGNLRFPRRNNKCAGSCPSSMRSSPTHSGLLTIGGGGGNSSMNSRTTISSSSLSSSSSSSMEELQSAIQGAIAHCKSTMAQSNQRKVLDVSTIGHND